MGEPDVCTRCGQPITDGQCVGDGDGSGQRFAHVACYGDRREPLNWQRVLRPVLDAIWREVEPAELAILKGEVTRAEAPGKSARMRSLAGLARQVADLGRLVESESTYLTGSELCRRAESVDEALARLQEATDGG